MRFRTLVIAAVFAVLSPTLTNAAEVSASFRDRLAALTQTEKRVTHRPKGVDYAQLCPPNTRLCPAGSSGPGGCYDSARYFCRAGLMCEIENPRVCYP
jgi:hypothetical protein